MEAVVPFTSKSSAESPGRRAFQWRYLGMACFWACSMLTFRSSILLTGEANSPECNTLVVIVSFLANMTVLLSISALVERASSSLTKLPAWLFCASIVAGLVLVHGAGHLFTGTPMLVMLLAGAVLCGIGYGYFWGSWASVLGRVHPAQSAIYTPAAFLATTVIFLLVSVAASWGALPALLLMVPLPVISLLCLKRCWTGGADRVPVHGGPQHYLRALTSLVPLIIAALVFSCLFGFMWETAVLSAGSATVAHELPLMLNLGAAALLMAFVLLTRRRISLSLAYHILIPITIVLFAVIPFFWNVQPVVLNAVMSAVYGVVDVIIWYLVVSTAYDFAVSGFVVGGIVRALAILTRLVGIGIGYIVMLEPTVADGAVVGICIGAVYLLVILLWFLWHNAKRRPLFAAAAEGNAEATPTAGAASEAAARVTAREEAVALATAEATEAVSRVTARAEAAEAARMDRRYEVAARDAASNAGNESAEAADDASDAIFALIAEDYGLTRREAEVLPYLARGRSAKVIAEALFVSESTIRTHTRRILEKTCLHSKQELIDLVDRY